MLKADRNRRDSPGATPVSRRRWLNRKPAKTQYRLSRLRSLTKRMRVRHVRTLAIVSQMIRAEPRRERAFLVGLEYSLCASREAGSARDSLLAQPERGLRATAPNSCGFRFEGAPHSDFSAEESLDELHTLATSAGAEIAGRVSPAPQPSRSGYADRAAAKLEEIAGAAASVSADLLLFDHDLTASQQRNIERVVDARIIDRTQLILDIFARHARTREGQLQVELAQLEYLLPRLAGRGIEMSQLGGGIGTRGPGETQLETDRRKIYRRIRHVKQQLENVRRIRAQQRQRRESVPVSTVALVGYTNAGKSTLFNALDPGGRAGSRRMFATLDPTIRGVDPAFTARSLAVGHGGIHSQFAPHAGLGVPRHAGRSAARRPDSARVGCRQSFIRRAGCASRARAQGTGSRKANRACG